MVCSVDINPMRDSALDLVIEGQSHASCNIGRHRRVLIHNRLLSCTTGRSPNWNPMDLKFYCLWYFLLWWLHHEGWGNILVVFTTSRLDLQLCWISVSPSMACQEGNQFHDELQLWNFWRSMFEAWMPRKSNLLVWFTRAFSMATQWTPTICVMSCCSQSWTCV